MTRILIADDHDVVRRGVRAILETQEGWEVVGEARDGKEAIDCALASRPDVAILDYALPTLNGVEVCRQILARVPSVEILIFTMHDTQAVVKEALEAGAKDFLLKSDAQRDLLTAVESLADHTPYFTATVSKSLLNSFLAKEAAKSPPLISQREKAIVQLIVEGQTNKNIASILGVSVKTVEANRAGAMRKFNVTTTAGLIRYAILNKVVEV